MIIVTALQQDAFTCKMLTQSYAAMIRGPCHTHMVISAHIDFRCRRIDLLLLQESVVATENAAPHLDLALTPVRRLSVMPLQPIASDSPVPCTSKSQVSPAAQSGREHVNPLSTRGVSDVSPFNVEDNRPCGGIVVQSCMQDVQQPCESHEHPLLPLGVRDIIDRYAWHNLFVAPYLLSVAKDPYFVSACPRSVWQARQISLCAAHP